MAAQLIHYPGCTIRGMEPQTRYTKTSDGVSIAYTVVGNGVPFVFSFPISHQVFLLESPVWRPWFEGLAEHYQLVIYDTRGNGLSQRDLPTSTETLALDLEAVVEHLSLRDFFVYAPIGYGHGAIRYAVAHPDRVAGLILWASFVNGAQAYQATERTTLVDLAEGNWEFFLQTIAQGKGWLDPREVRAYVDILKQCSTQKDYLSFIKWSSESDITPLLSEVHTPALVLHPRAFGDVKVEEAMRLASMLPNARLVLLESERFLPTAELVEPALRAITQFIADVTGSPASEIGRGGPSAFRTILFTDLVGHTDMMQRLGDERGRDVLREHERITRETLKANGGTEVKTMGDGFMASFGSVTKAVECAIALQRAFAEREGEPLNVRVGLNAGEPIEEDGDLFGATVILASRIAAKADGGEILVADTVRGLCSGKGFLFADRGDFVAKGFEEPVRISEVNWRNG
jgi:class 3 adenylate cyclase/pimeloyl-ACP methyl ester carboxylesterase